MFHSGLKVRCDISLIAIVPEEGKYKLVRKLRRISCSPVVVFLACLERNWIRSAARVSKTQLDLLWTNGELNWTYYGLTSDFLAHMETKKIIDVTEFEFSTSHVKKTNNLII